jgi:hypothetical protein
MLCGLWAGTGPRIDRSPSPLPLNLHFPIRDDLLPARNFLAQGNAEFLRGAADRIDADGRELPGEVRVLECTPEACQPALTFSFFATGLPILNGN